MSTNSNLTARPGLADMRPLAVFAACALPVGWILLSIPLLTGAPVEPFVLGVLFLGLLLPMSLIVRREVDTSGKSLLRDCFRLPTPAWLLLLAVALIPVVTWLAAVVLGGQEQLSAASIARLVGVNMASSILIINLWEELVWAGFVQRRATRRYGFLGGALLTAALFVGVHLPLAFFGASGGAGLLDNLARLVVAGIGLRLLIGAFDVWGRSSILGVAIIHASFNAAGELVDPDFDWVRLASTFVLGVLALAIISRSQRTITQEVAR